MSPEETSLDIIIVDDDDVVLTLMARALDGSPHRVRTADSGPQALALMKEQPADLLITDVRMPEMSGLELMEITRNKYPDVLVIVITVEDTLAVTDECLKRGAIYCLQKPVDFKTLRTAVNIAVDKARLRETLREEVAEPPERKKPGPEQEVEPRKKAWPVKNDGTSLYREIFQQAPAPMALFALNTGRIEQVNNCFSEKTGYRPEELLGKAWRETGLPADRSADLALNEKATEKAPRADLALNLKTKTGEVFQVKVSEAVLSIGKGEYLLWIWL